MKFNDISQVELFLSQYALENRMKDIVEAAQYFLENPKDFTYGSLSFLAFCEEIVNGRSKAK